MVLILTNDDGIDAPGIKALQDAVGGEGVMVAPHTQLSGCGHQVTTSRPFRVEKRSPSHYAVEGTPADCTRVALSHLYPKQVDWVLSGINAGGNMGVDVYISGTVAAVREAAFHGIPSIAVSHWRRRPLQINWERATRWTQRVLAELMALPLPEKGFWNVNLPHLDPGAADPEIVFCEPSIHPLPVVYQVEGDLYQYKGEYNQRQRLPQTDVDVCFGGNIAVTQIKL